MQGNLLHLEQQITVVDQKLSLVQNQVQETDERLKHIISLLVGNQLDKHDGGAMGRIDALERKLEEQKEQMNKMEKFQNKFIWVIVGISIGAGFGLNTLLEIIKHNP